MIFSLHNKHAIRTAISVLLILLQCAFVSGEALAENLLQAEQDRHHSLIADHSNDKASTVNLQHKTDTIDSCDHCCQCQGHSSHLVLLGQDLPESKKHSNPLPPAPYRVYPQLNPNAIDRPPIA